MPFLHSSSRADPYRVIATIRVYLHAMPDKASQRKLLSLTQKINEEMKENRLIIDFLEKGEKIFTGMSFDIKNITEIMKLETL